jgi:hypothetical protein
MLYLHCGWPRTSTTSLQTALFAQRGRLADAGIVYPDRWRSKTGLTHHGLAQILQASLDSEDALDDFTCFLAAHADRDVLFSAEALTFWLAPVEKQDAFVSFLDAAQEVAPVRCIWTLRRHDEVMRSFYLLRLKTGGRVRSPAGRSGQAPVLEEWFAGLRRVEEAVGGDVVYVKYDPTGRHNAELLRAFGVEGQAEARILEELERGPRLHAGPSHKQAVALTNIEALSARAGVDFEQAALRRAFLDDGFEFEQDWRCVLTEPARQRELHGRALTAARRHGVTAYVEFFGDAEVESSTPAQEGTDAITDADLERLVAFLAGSHRPSSERVQP